MRKSALLMVLFASPVVAADCTKCAPQATCVTGYVEETVTVKRPVIIKRTPVIETREKQVTVKENVVVGYKEEVVAAAPACRKPNLLGGLFRKRVCACGTCN